MQIISREEWADEPLTSRVKPRPPGFNVGGWVGHWPGEEYPVDDYLKELLSYLRYHLHHKGWSWLAYNFAVDPDGVIYEGRGFFNNNIANQGANETTLSVLFLGTGKGSAAPTEAAMKSVAWLMQQHPGNGRIRPHGEVSGTGTACPGPKITAALPKIEQLAKEDVVPMIDYEVSVTKLYNSVLGREPDQAGLEFWVDGLEEGKWSFVDVLIEFLSVKRAADAQVIAELAKRIDKGTGPSAEVVAEQAYRLFLERLLAL